MRGKPRPTPALPTARRRLPRGWSGSAQAEWTRCRGPSITARFGLRFSWPMHDIRWIREHQAEFDRGLARRGLPPRGEEVLALDRAWRAAETLVQEAQARRNRISRDIGAAKKRGENIEALLRQVDEDKDAEAASAAEAARLRAEIEELLA